MVVEIVSFQLKSRHQPTLPPRRLYTTGRYPTSSSSSRVAGPSTGPSSGSRSVNRLAFAGGSNSSSPASSVISSSTRRAPRIEGPSSSPTRVGA
ncbi:hypothetical protein EJ06DRAFT_526939 [Trichodelitschia bisporula]|uniref:Uncharacterized protein n=1 Tax=Trichodelitschia bisporula TaxID=703511 RepID=A0A6G1I501_9PEZI|nr:hypothetical protein EJ06DRAFT_526939 [Trichodelitschia bisporula]